MFSPIKILTFSERYALVPMISSQAWAIFLVRTRESDPADSLRTRSISLRVVHHFSTGIVDRASETRARVKITPREKGEARLIFFSPRRVSPFLAWGDYHARSRFACSTVPEDKWGTTRSLI